MSCKCPLCMGEDLTELLAITKTISSNISYTEPGEEEPDAPPSRGGFMSNSPPLKPAPAPAARPSLKDRMGVKKPPAAAAPAAQAPPPAAKLPPLDFQDVDMGNDEASTSSSVEQPERSPTASGASDGAAPARASSDDPALQMEELEAKVADKNWKVRKEVYDDLKAAFETGRPIEGGNVAELFGKMVDDSNAAAMECGLAAVLAYAVQVRPQDWNNGIAGRVMPKVIDKGFSGRPGTVKLAEELVLELVHLGSAEDTIAALLEGTKNKKPKVPPLCVNSILEAFKTFGPRVVPVPPVKKELKTLCESTVNNVRPTALKLIGELYRWTGPSLVQDIVATLRPAQQTEYETMIKDITPGQAAPVRYVKGKEPKAAPAKAKGKGGGSGPAAAVDNAIDPREFAETVDLMAKLPKTEFKAKMALPKWSEKVAALQIVLDTIGSVPKLANNGDFGDLVQQLKICTQDSNVNIVAKSIEVLGVLADGLRRHFAQYARIMLPVLLRKLSDKKSNVLNATHQSLDMFQQHALSIDNMMDELKTTVDATNKIPAARAQGVIFIQRQITKKTINVADTALMKTCGELFATCIEDSDPGLRKAGVDAMVTLVQSSDQAPRMVKSTLEILEKRQARSYKVIEAAMGGAGGGAEPSAFSVPKPATAASKPTASSASVPKEGSKTPSAGIARSNSLKKPPATAPAKATGKAGAAKAAPAATAGESITLSPEDAEMQLQSLDLDGWGDVTSNFQSIKWSDRKAGYEGIEECCQQQDVATANIEAFAVYIHAMSKGFKESNVQALKSAFQAMGTVASLSESMSPGVVTLVAPPAIDKIGDKKVSETIRPMLMAFSELVGPSLVLATIIGHMPNVKLPLAHVEVLEFMVDTVKDFGIGKCTPRGLIDFAKGPQGMESSNPKVRVTAIALFGAMYGQLGDSMRPLLNLDAWKSTLKDNVESEFKRVGYNPATAKSTIIRYVKGEAVEDDSASGSPFGRVDISAKITKDLLDSMQNEDDKVAWKKRMEAMEQAQRLCEEAGLSIELTKSVMELMKSLKARLSDSNANLKVKAVVVIGVVATSVGQSVAKLAKLVGNPLVVGVSDNKKTMQQACLDTLNKWVIHNDKPSAACFDSLLPFVAEALKNPVGRAELLGWTVAHTQAIEEKLDLRCLVENTIDALQDKVTEAREKAQLLLVDVFKSAGKEAVLAGCRDIVPAKMRTLKPIIDRAAAAAFAQSQTAPVEEEKPKAPSGLIRSSSSVASARPPSTVPPAAAIAAPAATSTATLRAPSPGPSRLATPAAPTALLISSDKLTRLDRNRKNKWIFDATDPAELQARKGQLESEWGSLLHATMRAKLFAVSYEKGMMDAIDDLSKCINHQPDEVHCSLDLILKWSTLRIVDNNVQALGKMLDLLVKLFQLLVDNDWELDDVEAAIFLPYLCQESGQQKPRFRMRFRDVMRLVVQVYPPVKLMPFLLECITNSKNSKSRSECLDLVEYVAETKGHTAVGKKTLRDIGKYVDSNEKEVRESAIGVIVKMYTLMGEHNTDKFFANCNISTQKSMDLVLQKIKYLPIDRVAKPIMPTPVAVKQVSMDEPAREPISTYEPVLVKAASFADKPSAPPSRLLERTLTPVRTPSSMQLPSRSTAHPPSTPLLPPTPVPLRPDFTEETATQRMDVRGMLFPPLERLMVSQRELTVDLDAFAAGKDALKSLYVMGSTDDDLFLQENVNEVLLRVCQISHATFGKGDAAPIELYVLSLCLSTLANITKHDAYNRRVQRVAIERVLLESCFGLLDPRIEDVEESFSQRIMTALNKLAMTVAYSLRISEVWPALINLLERIVHHKVEDYTIHDRANKAAGKPTLERLVAKLLVKTTRRELARPAPFKDADIVAILHAKHRFMTTFPDTDELAARNAMKASLKYAADYYAARNRPAFQLALNELPVSSPIHRMLLEMQHTFAVPVPDAGIATRGLTDAAQIFAASNDPTTKVQAAMTIVEAKMTSTAKVEVIEAKKEELEAVTEKLEMTDYNRAGAAASDAAIKTVLSRNNIFKDRSLETSAAPPGDQPPKSMALMDLKQRLARIQMH
ncbi:Aste57867_19395 [Aphanomyces stellatus]|uniref:Aste57867_19395 protein n=1 Tax=Aphanomyces stellatus TaxID=120398 RepID=A0A485LDU5_9STRA|nr:hypothetical protein As57867_019331 [Aphanomyces stellatus]VFT96109.1 Aste57867_19395 [Aphanomyces stellatus]